MSRWHPAHLVRHTWELLHDPKLRDRSPYEIACRNTTASGRPTSVIRLLCSLLVATITWTTLGPTDSPWWPAVTAVAFIGSALAILHTREDLIGAMAQSRFLPVQMIGVELERDSWKRLNLPGVLETVGPLAMAWMIGEPSGPFTGDLDARLLAASATLLYSGMGTLHWIIESVFYKSAASGGLPVAVARAARAGAPVVLGGVYALLLSRNADGTLTALPWLAACFLLLYPATVFYEKVLRSAVTEIEPAVVAQRLKDAAVVHSSISNPLHYVLLAARNHPAGDAENLIIYLRGELDRCLNELDHEHPATTVKEIVAGIRASLLPRDRARLVVDEQPASTVLGPIDASLARSVLADLCCNALKGGGDGRQPRAAVTTACTDGRLTIRVTDDGPGMGDGWQPGVSLNRLRDILRQLNGSLDFQPGLGTGTVVTATWAVARTEKA